MHNHIKRNISELRVQNEYTNKIELINKLDIARDRIDMNEKLDI